MIDNYRMHSYLSESDDFLIYLKRFRKFFFHTPCLNGKCQFCKEDQWATETIKDYEYVRQAEFKSRYLHLRKEQIQD